MLKIREILTHNGIKVETHFKIVRGNHTEEIKIDGGDINKYIINKGQTQSDVIELACRQHVKENGFKLEWLNEKFIVEDYKKLNRSLTILIRFIINNYAGYHNEKRVIAWLHANDIEIIGKIICKRHT